MHSTLYIALLAGLGSMVGWGSADFFAKKTIDKIGDIRTLFWQQLLGIIPLVVLFLFSPHLPHLHRFDLLFLLLLGAVSGLSYLPLYNGFGKGQLSLLSPIFASYSVLVAIISVVFLGEPLYLKRSLAIVIVLVGVLLISTDLKDFGRSMHKKAFKLAGLPEVASATVVYSIWLVFLDQFMNGKQWVFYILLIRIFSTLTLLAYTRVKHIPLWVKDRQLWKFLAFIGLFDVMAYSFVSYGFSHTQYPSVIVVLSATFSLPTLLLARVFLKERITKYQALAALVILAGVVLVSIS
jgi:drug/metabolite transporter (DMT)-like permease